MITMKVFSAAVCLTGLLWVHSCSGEKGVALPPPPPSNQGPYSQLFGRLRYGLRNSPQRSRYGSRPQPRYEEPDDDGYQQKPTYIPPRPSSYNPPTPHSSYRPSAYSPYNPPTPSPYRPAAPSPYNPTPSLYPPKPSPYKPPAPSSYNPPEPSPYKPPTPSSSYRALSPYGGNPPESSPYSPPARSPYNPPAPSPYRPPARPYNPPAPSPYNPPAQSPYNPPAPSPYSPPAPSPYNPPAPSSYSPPARSPYNPPATSPYNPPAPSPYNPPAPSPYSPPARSPYNPPATSPYNPPAPSSYNPPARSPYSPPARSPYNPTIPTPSPSKPTPLPPKPLDYCRPRSAGPISPLKATTPMPFFFYSQRSGNFYEVRGEVNTEHSFTLIYSEDKFNLDKIGADSSRTKIDFDGPPMMVIKVLRDSQACFVTEYYCGQDFTYWSTLINNYLNAGTVSIPYLDSLRYRVDREYNEYEIEDLYEQRRNIGDFCELVDRVFHISPGFDTNPGTIATGVNAAGYVDISVGKEFHYA